MDSLNILPHVKPSVIGLSTTGPFQLLVGGDLGPMGGQVQRDRISTRSFLLRAKLLLVLVCLGTVVSPAWALFSVCPKCNWRGDAPLGAACPNCGYGGNSSNSGGSGPSNGPDLGAALIRRAERKAEEARQKKAQAAWDANQRGVEFAAKEDWANAIKSYQLSLAKDPGDPIVLKNLARAQAGLANDRGIAASKKGDTAGAVAFYQEALGKDPNNKFIQDNLARAKTRLANEHAQQQEKAATADMKKAIMGLAETTKVPGTAPRGPVVSTGGLDFISGSPAGSSTPPADTLQFFDASARGSKGGAEIDSGGRPSPQLADPGKSDSAVVISAANKTISILDRTVSSTRDNLKASQSGESIDIDSELSEIKAMLNIPPSGKKGDHTIRTISFGHQKSGKSGDNQNVGEILVARNEETGEVHIDVTQELAGKAAKQTIIHIDRSGNIIAQESR